MVNTSYNSIISKVHEECPKLWVWKFSKMLIILDKNNECKYNKMHILCIAV